MTNDPSFQEWFNTIRNNARSLVPEDLIYEGWSARGAEVKVLREQLAHKEEERADAFAYARDAEACMNKLKEECRMLKIMVDSIIHPNP